MSQTNDRSLPTDLRDLGIFLRRRFPEIPSIPLYVESHYGSGPREIAFVVVGLPDQALRRQVRALAEAALRHLGYEIENHGRDVYDVWPELAGGFGAQHPSRDEPVRGDGDGRKREQRARRGETRPVRPIGRGPKLADRAPAGRTAPHGPRGRDGVGVGAASAISATPTRFRIGWSLGLVDKLEGQQGLFSFHHLADGAGCRHRS